MPTRSPRLSLLSLLPKILWAAGLIVFVGLMLGITIPYLVPPFRTDIDFLLSKQDVLPLLLWRVAFYGHIVASPVVLLTGGLQFWRRTVWLYPRVHRWLGYIYIITILAISAPTGLVLAVFANGGLPTQIAFTLLALGWFATTFWAYRTAIRKDFAAHERWMTRSYALTCSAITLRLLQFVFGYTHCFEFETAYLVSAWCSWTLNLAVAEVLLRWQPPLIFPLVRR